MNESTLLVRATLALYRDAMRDAARALGRNLWIVALPPAFWLVLRVVQQIAGPLGMVGGFVVFLVIAACVSSYLSVVAEAVAHERIRPEELAQTFGRYLSSVAGVMFIFYVIEFLLSLITAQNPGLGWLALVINLALFLVCNPLPELIYQGARDGIALVDDAVQFMRENAIEWLVPMGILLLPVFAIGVPTALMALSRIGATSVLEFIFFTLSVWLPPLGVAGQLVLFAVASLILCWIMLFRGFLFRTLAQSGRRQRIFGARMRGL